MSIRTTVTLDDDVIERVKEQSRVRGQSFREALNDLIRTGLIATASRPKRGEFRVKPHHGGYYPGLNYDCTESLIEHLEGPQHR